MKRSLITAWMALALAFAVLGVSFLAIGVANGRTQTFDEKSLRLLRNKDDVAKPIGPRWLRNAMRDATALGSTIALCILSATACGYLLLRREYRETAILAVAVASAFLFNRGLKLFFDRPRPSIVPHMDIVDSKSFPSGHALLATFIYCTLGVLLASFAAERRMKVYIIVVASGMALLVGITRIYLGVHYPTDVLAGWMLGLVWAAVCWMIGEKFRNRTVP